MPCCTHSSCNSKVDGVDACHESEGSKAGNLQAVLYDKLPQQQVGLD